MDGIVTLVTELGSFGLLLGLAGWIIYGYFKEGGKHAKDRSKAEFREMLGLTVNQLKYLQLKDCVTNSLHNLSFFPPLF